jgi:DNA-binding GntR family transcriptional regulator
MYNCIHVFKKPYFFTYSERLIVKSVKRYNTTPALIADTLRGEIKIGNLLPGGALRQEDLASRFEVSRIPIREALLLLQSEGLVVIYPNRGAYVSELSHSEIEEIYDLRILLECDVLTRAIPVMNSTDHRAVRAIMLRATEAGAAADWSDLDWQFHHALYLPSGRLRQLSMIESLRATVDRYWTAYVKLADRNSDWLQDHDRMAATCFEGRVEKATAMLRSHLLQAKDHVLGAIPTH